ncbi:MAG: ABC transporter permease [Jatrophihabitans sp.]
MLIFTIRRLIGSIIVLLITSFLVFTYVASEYDPLKPYRQIPNIKPQTLANLRHQFHLDQPVLSRYWDWLSHLIDPTWSFPFIHFNFGLDYQNNPISGQLATRLEVTTRMIVGAILLAMIMAIVLGVISGVRRDKPIDVGVTILTFILIALPTFWFAALLKDMAIRANTGIFHERFLQVTLEESPGIENYAGGWEVFRDQLTHLVLPTLSLGLLTAASWIRYQRASTIEVLDADYMRLARAKGVRNRTVIRRHGLRNALIPLVTVMAIDVGALFGGAIITEKVYAWNGMGDFLFKAFTNEDSYAVIGWVMVSAIFVVLFNLLADLLYAVLDPRIRLT